jgi:predicted  nucleic acid-binding Zn-ribbon protein
MKYQDQLNELAINAEKLTPSIKKSIAELDDIIDTYHQAKKALENATDEEEIEDIKNDIEHMKGDINDLDEKIVEKINDYNKNKDFYAERAKKMQDGRKAKSSGNKEIEPVVETTVKPQAQPQPQPQAQSQPQPKIEILQPAKKKTNWALWLVAGIVAVITVNQVLIKTED